MATELDFTPPEIPDPTFMENILHYGLFFGAIFQLICVLAIILPIPKLHKPSAGALLAGFLWVNHILQEGSQDTEGFESKSAEVVKKTKVVAASANKKPKKETKKKR